MTRLRNINLGHNVFRCVCIVLMLFEEFFWLRIIDSPEVAAIILPWGFTLLLCDLLYKRRLFQVKQIWMLATVIVLFAVAILVSGLFKHNLYILLFMTINFLVLLPPDKPVSVRNKYKNIFIFFAITIIPATILSAVSIWAQITQYGIELNGRWLGYAAGYESRLSGFFGHESKAAALSCFSVAMLVISRAILPKITVNKRIITAAKIVIPIMVLLNFTMLTLTDYRSWRFGLLLFALLFSFLAFLRVFSGRFSSVAKSCISAMVLAGIITGAAYLADKPVRTGVAYLQYAVNRTENVEPDLSGYELSILGRDADKSILSVSVRYQLWQYGYELVKQHPVLGVTYEAFPNKIMELINNKTSEELFQNSLMMFGITHDELIKKGMTEDNLIEGYKPFIIGSSLHNAYLEFAVTNGIPALLLMLLFLVLFAIRNAKILFSSINNDFYLIAGGIFALCAVIVFYNMFESHICQFDLYPTMLFWICLGFGATLTSDIQNSAKGLYLDIKRAGDIVLSFIGIVILLPVFLVLMLITKIDSKGHVFFKQKRIGIDKSCFNMLKFRTMRIDTPKDVPTHKLKNPEQYITRMGRFLRKTSLDELPQIFHILSGKMSIVGPRPALWNQDDLIAERDKYGANDIRPGLTGWAQINGRDELPIPVKAKFDGEYVQNMGVLLDCKCIFRTFTNVLKGQGVVEGGTGTLGEQADRDMM